jgi:hypothetical protein
MTLRLLFTTLIFGLILILGMGNKNGRASSQNRGNTGAPGDETSLGQPKTCQNCHNQGPILASLDITVLNANNQPITQYQPGQQYTASVKITATGTGLQGYGFQMIALRDAGNTDLDGFTDTNPNNYKIATITNGRTYAEHDNISTDQHISMWPGLHRWLALAISYISMPAGNGVNGNGTTSGDGGAKFSLHLQEFGTVAANEPQSPDYSMRLSPNPVIGDTRLNTGTLPTGQYRARSFNASAKMVWESPVTVTGPSEDIQIPAAEWQAGLYYIQLEGAHGHAIVKVVKL